MRRTTAATGTTAVRPPRTGTTSPRPALWLVLLAGFAFATSLLWAQGLGAQQPNQRKGGPAAGRPGAPGVRRPMGTPQPRPQASGRTPAAGSAPAQALQQQQPVQLPPGYQPPAEIPPQMTLEKPLKPFPDEPGTAQEQLEALGKSRDLIRARGLLQEGNWNDEAKKLIPLWVKYNLYSMTVPENRAELNKLRDAFIREIGRTGRLAANSNRARQFRQNVAKEIVTRAEELLDNNFAARMQAVVIMAYLNETENDSKLGTKEQPYIPAVDPLLKVISSEDQLDPVKVVAVNGLKRMLLLAGRSVPAEKKHEIARTLVAELEDPESHHWYQMRLADTLAAIDQPVTILPNGDAKPIIVQTLLKIVLDQDRHWCARAHAARALGRATIDRSINLELIGFALTRLANEMAAAYNAEPNKWFWKSCFWDLYLAFRPADQDETQRYDRPGLLSRYSDPPITQSHQVIVPLVKHVLSQENQKRQPLPRELVNATSEWLQENQPANLQVFPGADPILSVDAREPAAVARTPNGQSR